MSEGASPTPEPGPRPYRYQGGACPCARCRCRGLLWPVLLIVIGVIFLVPQFLPQVRLHDWWPVILIVIGVIKLIESTASTEGHRG